MSFSVDSANIGPSGGSRSVASGISAACVNVNALRMLNVKSLNFSGVSEEFPRKIFEKRQKGVVFFLRFCYTTM